jgi:hypothetical protein
LSETFNLPRISVSGTLRVNKIFSLDGTELELVTIDEVTGLLESDLHELSDTIPKNNDKKNNFFIH